VNSVSGTTRGVSITYGDAHRLSANGAERMGRKMGHIMNSNLIAQTINVVGQALGSIDRCLLGTCTGSALLDHLSLEQTLLS
jgi:hypothetical protein